MHTSGEDSLVPRLLAFRFFRLARKMLSGDETSEDPLLAKDETGMCVLIRVSSLCFLCLETQLC